MTYHEPTRRTFTFRGNEWLIYPRGESYFAKFVKYDSDTGPFSTFEQAYDFARRAMTRTVSPSPEQLSELRKLILGRIGEEFDGECHLTEAEALQAADALESAQAEIARLTTVSGLDEDGLMMVMLNELHSNMPEIDRPMSLSDLSDAQTERARKAVRAVTQAAATIAKGRIERLEAALAKCADKFDFYEQLHRLKCTAEGDEKADRNRELADMCRAALKASPNVG
jgi:hypothetical protein